MADLDAHLPAIVAGDPDAFGRWVAGAEPRLRASLRPYAAAIDAEPVLQETLLRVWQVAPRHVPDGRPDSLVRLAIRIARNLAVDEARRRRTEGLDPQAIELVDPGGDAPGDPLLRRAIAECRDKLGGKPLQALDARLGAAGGEPDEALAARLGMRLNTFLQNVTRARRLLADCLRRRGVDLDEVLA